MKKIIILAIVAILTIGTMSAQTRGGNRGGRMSTKDRVEMLKKELNLTDEQTEKITLIYTDFEKKMSNMERGDREKMRTEMEKLNKDVEDVLDDEQKQAYKKLQERDRGRRGERRGDGRGGNRGGGERS